MSVNGRDFLIVADKCFELENETGYRSSISRSYYGFYHETCSILTCCPPTTHDGVVHYLLNDARRKGEPYDLMSLVQLGAVLQQQKIKRKKADYELGSSVTESEAASAICVVKKMLAKIDEMKSMVA